MSMTVNIAPNSKPTSNGSPNDDGAIRVREENVFVGRFSDVLEWSAAERGLMEQWEQIIRKVVTFDFKGKEQPTEKLANRLSSSSL